MIEFSVKVGILSLCVFFSPSIDIKRIETIAFVMSRIRLDILLIFIIVVFTEECIVDHCTQMKCRHDGKCLSSDQGAICLCPLGFGGDLCEMRLDLQVID